MHVVVYFPVFPYCCCHFRIQQGWPLSIFDRPLSTVTTVKMFARKDCMHRFVFGCVRREGSYDYFLGLFYRFLLLFNVVRVFSFVSIKPIIYALFLVFLWLFCFLWRLGLFLCTLRTSKKIKQTIIKKEKCWATGCVHPRKPRGNSGSEIRAAKYYTWVSEDGAYLTS